MLVDVGVEASCRFVWEFRGVPIVVFFEGVEFFFLASKNSSTFAYAAAALAFADSSALSCSSFKRFTRNLAWLDARSVDFFLPGFGLLGFVILDGLDILSMLLLLKVCLGICECYCVNVVRIM